MSLLTQASLIVTPNGYKEGKLYSVIPSDGSGDLSVTRATTATRVNSAGLVELVPYNLAQYSEQFDNAIWYKDAVTISANATTAPDGTLTADLIYPQSSGNFKYIYQAYTQGNNVYTSSVYVKAQNKSKIWMYIESVGGYGICYFDLTNGTIQATTLIGSIESVGNGWYRCSVTTASSLSLVSGTGFGVCDALGSTYVAANGTDGVYIWGAQLVEGSVAKDYQKTETRLNIPRLDYSNGTCPSILVEPQRTNLALYSSSFDNAAWVKDNNGSGTLPVVTANYATAPDGTMSADRAQFSNVGGGGSGSNYSMLIQFGLTLSSTGTATIYLKSNTSSNQEVLLYWAGGEGDVFTVTPEWQRFTLSNLSAASTGIVLGTRGGSGNFFNGGDEVLDILVWGAQLEAGSYATSYIPTTSASVTRNADVISKTGISSLIGQTEGSVFLDVDYTNRGTNYLIQLTDGTNDFIELYIAGGVMYFSGYNGSSQWDISTALTNGRHKIAYAYKSNDIVFYVDGVLIGTDTSAAIPTCNGLYVNQNYTNQYNQKQYYNAVALWTTRLTNAQLATLTTI